MKHRYFDDKSFDAMRDAFSIDKIYGSYNTANVNFNSLCSSDNMRYG